MDEILALQAALSAAQEQKSSIRLSERNIVELVNKLKDMKLLDASLMYTLNGKEYVTRDRLDAEIKREVRLRGGRVPVVDLQVALNVDVTHCERRARALAEDPANEVALVEGELMTPAYFDQLAHDVDEELREAGVVSVGDLARRHGLSADLATRALAERVGADENKIVDGKIVGGLLYTRGYVARLTAQLRGAMRAALVPTTRDALVNSALGGWANDSDAADADAADAELTGAVVADLAKKKNAERTKSASTKQSAPEPSGLLRGALRGGAWHPEVYSRAQTAAVAEAYARVGLVTAEQAARAGVEDAASRSKTFRAMDPEGVELEHAFVSRAAIAQLDAAVVEALAECGWCEAEALMPPDLPAADAPAMLARTPVAVAAAAAAAAAGAGGKTGGGKKSAKGGNKGNKAAVKDGGDAIVGHEDYSEDHSGSTAAREAAEKKAAATGDARAVGDVALATRAFLGGVEEKARALGAEAGREEGRRRLLGASSPARTGASSKDPDPPEASSKDSDPPEASSKDSDPLETAFAVTAEDLEDDEDDAGGKKRRGGKKGSRGRKGGGEKGGAAGVAAAKKGKKGSRLAGSDASSSLPHSADAFVADAFVSAAVLEAAPGASAAFVSAVASLVRPAAAEAFAAALAATEEARADRHKARRHAALAAFEEAYPRARLFAKGAAWLAEDIHAQKHCAKTRVAPVVDTFLRAHAEVSLAEDDEGSGEKEGLEDEDAARSGPGAGAGAAATRANDANAALAPLEPASRSAAARSITASASARSAFASLAEAANAGRDPNAIVAALEAAAEAIGTRLRGWDKKAERALAHAHRKSLEASLAATTDPAAAVALAVPLVAAAADGAAVALTGRSLPAAIEKIAREGALESEADAAFLRAFHADVARALAGEAGEGVETLAGRVDEVKRVALGCKKRAKEGGGGRRRSSHR